jgi:mitochondrial inner membrane protease ATP23
MSNTNAEEDTKRNDRCRGLLESTLKNNKKVHKLLDGISELGCKIPKDFFSCQSCPTDIPIAGGFSICSGDEKDYKPQVVLCDNKILERESFENAVIHELVHAYDQCRIKMDWKNCFHHACTEIRASSLSGECAFLHEVYRGKASVSGGHSKCVKRRAELSVKMNPYCEKVAKESIEAVFPQCYSDENPFEKS